ncbi:MAG: helix-turn-helix domain-containing protein [Treponema sp.]|nr:helix-turn-helix domain-containing protein [Treponema sp.]
MQRTNIIQRRDLEPLRHKATEVAQHYEKSANCVTTVVGASCATVEFSGRPNALLFCRLCKKNYQSAEQLGTHQVPCSDLHAEAIQESRKRRGYHIYVCPLGFYFWTSPFFSGERYAGSLISSGAAAVDKKLILERLFKICRGEVSQAELAGYLNDVPEKTYEEIKVYAQMQQLCAEKISHRESQWEDTAGSYGELDYSGFQRKFMEQERSLIASLRRGDNDEARNTVRELLNSLNAANNGNLEHLKLKSMELVVMLSRTEANGEGGEGLIEANNRYLNRIEDSSTIEEVFAAMYLILEQMAGKIFSFRGIRHASALRKAERFIWENYTRKISLKEIADVSGLSAPYFSTIFKDEMGENLSNYLNRLRIEKASAMLRETEFPINGISTACGFEDQSWFSKVFKNYTGFSPCKYREHGGTVENGKS